MNKSKKEEHILKEKCVLCGSQTDICVTKNIKTRKCYIYGSGQLCDKCYVKIYNSNLQDK